ncbi:hypothetical protein AAY473_007411 [Plecturocebus cupreus]
MGPPLSPLHGHLFRSTQRRRRPCDRRRQLLAPPWCSDDAPGEPLRPFLGLAPTGPRLLGPRPRQPLRPPRLGLGWKSSRRNLRLGPELPVAAADPLPAPGDLERGRPGLVAPPRAWEKGRSARSSPGGARAPGRYPPRNSEAARSVSAPRGLEFTVTASEASDATWRDEVHGSDSTPGAGLDLRFRKPPWATLSCHQKQIISRGKTNFALKDKQQNAEEGKSVHKWKHTEQNQAATSSA